MVINKRINSIIVYFQPEGTEPPTSQIFDDEHTPGIVDGIMRQFRAHEDIVVTLPNRDIVVIPFYSILEIVTGFEISEVTITDDVCNETSNVSAVKLTIKNSSTNIAEGVFFTSNSLQDALNGEYTLVPAIPSGQSIELYMVPSQIIGPLGNVDMTAISTHNLELMTVIIDGDGYNYWVVGSGSDRAEMTIFDTDEPVDPDEPTE